MSIASRVHYYRRIFPAYLGSGKSQLTFWHDDPQLNQNARFDELREYYMSFLQKANYSAHVDPEGVPLLDYHGKIGRQYNPIAIAQWGLGNYSELCRTGDTERKRRVLLASDWLCENLEQNSHGVWVWNHDFDWEYRNTLQAPWFSGLAQGQGISLLVRTHQLTGNVEYLRAAAAAFESFLKPISKGGVTFTDEQGDIWFEEYLVTPPTHILNGFIWAIWGVYDYFLATLSDAAHDLFTRSVKTLRSNLPRYDLGFWSLYELSGTRLPMVASPFYHRLHVAQLRVMHRMTGDESFSRCADRWEQYSRSRAKRTRALCYKSAFKLSYY